MIWQQTFSVVDMTAIGGSFGETIYSNLGKINNYDINSGTGKEITHYFAFHPKIILPAVINIYMVWYEEGTVSADTKDFTASIRGWQDIEAANQAMTATAMPDAIAAGDQDKFHIAQLLNYSPIGSIAPNNMAILRFSRTDSTSGSPQYVNSWITYPISLGV